MKIISGGQTGADRAALDFAIKHGIDYGGRIPKGRLAEDGVIPKSYSCLSETDSTEYPVRTRLNVAESDGTLILSHGPPTGGTLLTRRIATALKRPACSIDLNKTGLTQAANIVNQWIGDNSIRTMNVAGPRASGDPLIYDATLELLTMIFD